MSLTLASITIGLHLVSQHIPDQDWHNNQNFGVFARTESLLQVGVYRNTLDSTSFYIAQGWEKGPWMLQLGLATGYHKRTIEEAPKGPDGTCAAGGVPPCTVTRGVDSPVVPLLAVSYRLPPVLGVVPRVTGSYATQRLVFHLSVEKTW